jgi:hypothetical protein
VIFLENHIYFTTPAAGCFALLLFRSLRSLGCMLKNFFGFWTLFNFSGLRRTLRPKYLLRPEKIENHLKIL